jgi:CxxC motif-containing protein (DUF1111 family)
MIVSKHLAYTIAVALSFGAVLASVTKAGRPPGLREQLLAIPLTHQLGGDGTRPLARASNAFSLPMSNAPRSHQRPFSFGNRLFNTNWTKAPGSVKSFDGLGPMFNRVSCAGCHTLDGRGRPPANGEGPFDSMLIRLSLPGTSAHGGPNPHPVYGDQLSERANHGVAPEGVARISYEEVKGTYGDGETFSLRKPAYAITGLGYGPLGDDVMMSPRVAPQMIGLGLLQMVPGEVLLALADPDDADNDGISGRANRVWDETAQTTALGRFGWKANQPSLRQQNAGAALGDIGLTTALGTDENCSPAQTACSSAITGGAPEFDETFLDRLTLYTMILSVPAQRDSGSEMVRHGESVFRSFGCAACHMPSLVSGESRDVPEVSKQTFHPFTDLLLHDMGEGLADGRPDFEASGREWRTPPLWGLGLVPAINGHDTLLHDGRARGFAEAVLWHAGEGETSKEAFRTAPKSDRDALIAFLSSL